MKVCIIGCSGHYDYALDGIGADRDIQADGRIQIAGVAPGSAGEDMGPVCGIARKLGHSPQIFDDFVEMLDALDPDIAVINCHFGDHARIAVETLRRKINVFIEKPVATTLEDLEHVREVYMGSGVHLAAMFALRYCPWFLTAWTAVRDGAIGVIRLMNAQKSYKLGPREEFFKSRKTYGGTIPWVGSHAIDWLYWFYGQKFEAVFASHSTRCNQGNRELETTAVCHFIFPDEVFGSVNIDYMRPSGADGHDDDRIRIVGTKGIIEVRDKNVYLMNDSNEGTQQLKLLPGRNMFMDFVRQVRGEGKCMVSADDSFYITEICLKARQAADEKRIIRL